MLKRYALLNGKNDCMPFNAHGLGTKLEYTIMLFSNKATNTAMANNLKNQPRN